MENYKGSIKRFLDEFSDQAINFSEPEIASYKEALLNFFDCVEDISTKKKESLWPGLFVVSEKKKFDVRITKEICKIIEESDEYEETNTSGTSSKSDIEARLKYIDEQI